MGPRLQRDMVLLVLRLAALVVVALSTFAPGAADDRYERWLVVAYFALSEFLLMAGSRRWVREGIAIGIFFLDIFALTLLMDARQFALPWFLAMPLLMLGTTYIYRRRGGWLLVGLIPSVFIVYGWIKENMFAGMGLLELTGIIFLLFAFAWAAHFILGRLDRFYRLYRGQQKLVRGVSRVHPQSSLNASMRAILKKEVPLSLPWMAILVFDDAGHLNGLERQGEGDPSEVRVGQGHVPELLRMASRMEGAVASASTDPNGEFFKARKVASVFVNRLNAAGLDGLIVFGREGKNAFSPEDQEIFSLYAAMIRGWIGQGLITGEMDTRSDDLRGKVPGPYNIPVKCPDPADRDGDSARIRLLEEENRLLKRTLDEEIRCATDQLNRAGLSLAAKESELNHQVLEKLASNDLCQAVALLFDLDTILDLVLDTICSTLSVVQGSIMIFREESDELVMRAHRGFSEEGVEKTRLMVGEAIAGYVAQKREPLMIADIGTAPRFVPFSKDHCRASCLLSVPILHDEKVLGVINLSDPCGEGTFNERELDMVLALSRQAAMAIENERLYTEFRNGQWIRELYEMNLASRIAERLFESERIIEPVEGEYRVSVLTVRFHERTPALADLTAAGKLDQIERDYRAVRDILTGHQGDISGETGAGFVALFGIPYPGKDDAWHAVEAAVDLIRASSGRPLQGHQSTIASGISVGISTGEVLLRKKPGPVPYAVFGETWMRAVTLTYAGSPGQILVDEQTYGQLENRVSTLPLVLPWGMNKRLAVYAVKGLKVEADGNHRPLAELHG